MAGEIVTSTGSIGVDFQRSAGRAYYTHTEVMSNLGDVHETWTSFEGQALSRGRRRSVLRTRVSRNVGRELVDLKGGLPVEAAIPLNLIDESQDDYILMIARNAHRSDVPEWNQVSGYWQKLVHSEKSPFNRVEKLSPQGMRLVSEFNDSDVSDLAKIWKPFGWTEAAVRATAEDPSYWNEGNRWFSGVVDTESNRLVAACMGERLDFAGVSLVEGTEYGTLTGFEGRGLCTGAVVGLHAQILRDTVYSSGEVPLILSEFNMTARSDVIGRHAGMTVPFVEGVGGRDVRQVLRHNVDVLDSGPQNEINMNEIASNFRAAFAETTPGMLRNFIVGMLPESSIKSSYDRETVMAMNERIGER